MLANNRAFTSISNPLVSVSLLVVGTSAVISILLPYTSESFPVRLGGRATGWVAGCSKVGGVLAQGLALLALVPAFALAAGLTAIPTVASRCWSRFLAVKREDVIFANWKANSCGLLKGQVRRPSFFRFSFKAARHSPT